MRPVLRLLFILAISLLLTAPASAQFQRQFGTSLDETFNKVIKSGTNYYVLGTGEITNGQQPRATVTRLNAAGELQWTLSLNTASQWNDAALTPNGDLLVVGRSLPDDNTSRAIMGRVTAAGAFSWVRSYDQPNRDGFDRIVRNPVPQTGTHPYYVLGHQLQALPAVDDVFLMNIDENGDINWKKIYLSSVDDEFTNVLLAMPNGDLILGGHRSGEGFITRANNTGALFNGATPAQPFTFIDVASAGGAGFYAVGYNFQQEKVQLISFDVDLFNQWEVTINGFTAVNNVFTAAGSIFLGGRKVREACARMSIGAGGPTLTWVKTLDNGVLTQTASHLSFLSPAQIAYVDGRTIETGGFGQNCAFMSLSDLELNTCMTEVEDDVFLTSVSTLYNGPVLPDIEFYDEPMGTNLTGGPRTWQQGEACPDPANASIIGVKYKECNGFAYSDQTPIAGWVIQLLNSQGTIIGEQVTGADGSYAFTDLPLGQYIIKEIAQPGWTPNVPPTGQLAVTLAASEQRVVNFGNCPPPQLFCACPAGSQPANNNLAANGNFSGGNTGFSSGYTFSNTPPLQPGQYWVGSNPSQINAGFTSCGDHTSGSGNMLVVNGAASTSSTIWCQTYTVVPNSSYLFEVWVASLTSASPANLMLFVNNVSYGAGFFASNTSCNWEKYCTLWESGTNTSVTLCLVDLNTAGTGNDFALDDISFKRCIAPFGGITGTVYQVCDSLPFTDQPVLPGWTVQLLDETETTVLAEQVTGDNGEYAFADLPLGLYYCRVVNQPGWTPKIPFDSKYLVNLGSPDPVVRDFGMCPLSPPCDVTINAIYVDNCGHVQLDAVASGPSDYSYQWCSGESTQMLDLMLPCGEHDFCVSVTCSDGSVASDAITVVVTDNIPPTIVCPQNVQFDCFSPTTPAATGFASATDNCNFPLVTYSDAVTGSQPCDQLIVRTWKAEDWCNNISTCTQTISVMDNVAPTINCPQDMTFTALDPNCDMPVSGIHSLGSTDNCGTPTVTYVVSGATTASGSGDASGTTFSSGTSTVTYTATDGCNNTSSCSFDVTIDCDTCACLGFQNLEFYNFLSGPNLPALCDSTTVMLPCIGSDALYWFQWGLLCSDPLCQQSYSYSIVPAAGGPALVSGTVPLGSPPFLNFAYNQLSGPGNYTIILTGHCGADSCVCQINFSVPNCCECGGFSGTTYRPTQGIMNLPFMCGDTMGVDCNQTFLPQVGGLFQCVGSSCPNNNPIQWVLTDPQGNVIQSSPNPVSANPGFGFTLDPTWFVQPGTYALTMTGKCGGVPCDSCVLYLESLGCSSQVNNCCLEWAWRFGGALDDSGRETTVDASGNVYVTGVFRGIADFDPTNAGILNIGSQGVDDIFISKFSSSGNFIWVKTIGGPGVDEVTGVRTDAFGNIYLTGSFQGTVDFDPGLNTFFLSSTGNLDIFLLKLDPSGGFLWAFKIGSASLERSMGLSPDGAGDIYIAGFFSSTTDFDPGLGVTNLTPSGSADMFISKFSSAGAFIWAKQIGGTSQDVVESITVDQTGNIYFTGRFGGTVDFDPGPGIFNLTTAFSSSDLFVAKLDPSGNFAWASAFSNTSVNSNISANSITTDAQGNVLTTGLFFGPIDFDPGVGTSILTPPGTSAADGFVSKLNSNGNFVWIRQIGGNAGDGGESIATDLQGNVYTTGAFSDLVDFDPGPGSYPLSSVPNIPSTFIQKLDASGDFMWAKQIEGLAVNAGLGLWVDANEAVYCTGTFESVTDFDPGPSVHLLSPYGGRDIYIFKLSECELIDTCICGGFTDMFVRGPQGAMSQPVSCGGPPLNIGCAQSGIGYVLTGIFQCDGATCPDSTDIDWDLLGPNGGSIASGMVPSNPLFGLPLLASYFAQPGVYTLNLTGYCGSDTCTCTITLLVPECPDPCPCDLVDLNNDVSQGFATAYSTYSCKVCLTPLALTDCDEVEWYVNQPFGQPVGTSIGNQTFCYNFPVGGTYTVYMSVIRRRSDGSFCESSTKSQTVTVTCLARAVCDVSAFPNPDFDEGAVEGSFLEGGMSGGWTRLWGDPHVSINGVNWKFSKRGNFTGADVVGTIEPVCLAKDTGTISLRYGIREKGIKSAIVVQFFTSDNYEFGVCESADCYEVARIELPDSDNPEEEFEVEIPYDISNWDAAAICGDQPGVRVRPAIYVTGPFSDEQGPGSLTIIDLDYFCVDGSLITSQSEPELKQRLLLYPNPNTGQFTLDWQGAPWLEGRVEIAGPLGQALRSFAVPEGASQMEVKIADLPAGMYFVKVLSEGRVVKVMKVVRL